MSQENLLSVSRIAQELNTGRATIKFLLKRFKKHLPGRFLDGRLLYPPETIKTLLAIQGKIEMGQLPSEIESSLLDEASLAADPIDTAVEEMPDNGDIRLSRDGLAMLKSLFSDIGEQQKRIAAAHEKRAQAEERKAVAIEKRATAEEKKAHAMNNIATALQEMNQNRLSDPGALQIAHQAAAVVTGESAETEKDERPGKENTAPMGDDDESQADISQDNLSSLIAETESFDNVDADLATLIEEDEILEEEAFEDPLAQSLDFDFDVEMETDIGDPLADLGENPETDDLSDLIDAEDEITDMDLTDQDLTDLELDDLSALLSEDTQPPINTGASTEIKDLPEENAPASNDIDDLYQLIEDSAATAQIAKNGDTDDLSMLIDIDTEPQITQPSMDDLNALIAMDIEKKDMPGNDLPDHPMDDLSQLIEQSGRQESTQDAGPAMDDLSLLIDTPDASESIKLQEKSTPSIKIEISPEDNLEKYKAAVMRVIIGLKKEGLTVEEATHRLNENKVKTLSGKPEWSVKAISRIYKFIEAAK